MSFPSKVTKGLKKAIATIQLVVRDIEQKHLPIAAAGAAYYLLMSVFPAAVVLAAVLAYLPLANGMHGTVSFLAYVIPQQGLPLIENLLTTIPPHRAGLLSFGLITTLWVASMGFKGIILGLDMVYSANPPRQLWASRILAFGLTLAVGLLLLLGIILILAGPVMQGQLSRVVAIQSLWITVWPFIRWTLVISFIFAAVELLYVVGPNKPVTDRLTIPGALVATASWIGLAWGFGFYLHHFGELKLNMLYGFLATPVACMVWMNLNAAVILLGAEINVSLQKSVTKTGS